MADHLLGFPYEGILLSSILLKIIRLKSAYYPTQS